MATFRKPPHGRDDELMEIIGLRDIHLSVILDALRQSHECHPPKTYSSISSNAGTQNEQFHTKPKFRFGGIYW